MKYLITRLIENKEPVCVIHYSKNLDNNDIFWAVDEYTNPYDCEIKIVNVPYQGIGHSFGWREQCELDDTDGEGSFIIGDVNLGEWLMMFLYDSFENKKGWTGCPSYTDIVEIK